MWILGIELRLAGLAASTLPYLLSDLISPTLLHLFVFIFEEMVSHSQGFLELLILLLQFQSSGITVYAALGGAIWVPVHTRQVLYQLSCNPVPSIFLSFFFFKTICPVLGVGVFCPHVVCALCTDLVPSEARRGPQISWDWSHWQYIWNILTAYMGAGNQPQSFARALCAPDHWAVSLAPSMFCLWCLGSSL